MKQSITVRCREGAKWLTFAMSQSAFHWLFPDATFVNQATFEAPDGWLESLKFPYGGNQRAKKCHCCGRSDKLTRHHVVPKRVLREFQHPFKTRLGGAGIVVTLCRNCHTAYEERYANLPKLRKREGLWGWVWHFEAFLEKRRANLPPCLDLGKELLMQAIGVPAQKYITTGEATFPRQMTTRDLLAFFGKKDEEGVPLHDQDSQPILGTDTVTYFTFQGKNYLRYTGYEKYVSQMSVPMEKGTLWEFLESKGLCVASNLQMNDQIVHGDVLGMPIPRGEFDINKGMTLTALQEKFAEAKRLLEAVGVTEEPELRVDQKWPAD